MAPWPPCVLLWVPPPPSASSTLCSARQPHGGPRRSPCLVRAVLLVRACSSQVRCCMCLRSPPELDLLAALGGPFLLSGPAHAGRPGGWRGTGRSCRAHAILQEACVGPQAQGTGGFSQAGAHGVPGSPGIGAFQGPEVSVCVRISIAASTAGFSALGAQARPWLQDAACVLGPHSSSWLPVAVSAFPLCLLELQWAQGSHPALRPQSSSPCSLHLSYCVPTVGCPPGQGCLESSCHAARPLVPAGQGRPSLSPAPAALD